MSLLPIRRLLLAVVFPVAAVCVGTHAAHAEPIKCQRTIAKEAAKLAQREAAALAKCEELRVKGKLAGSCPDAKTAAKLTQAATALHVKIGKACGGADKRCGGDTTNEDDLAAIEWPSVCPTIGDGRCGNPITTCADIATCLQCVHETAVDQVVGLAYRSAQPSAAGSPLEKCQLAIGKSAIKFLQAQSKALAKCWDARLQGKHANLCPSPGDGKAVVAISKAAEKQRTVICKACGGGDKACGGADDQTPAAIGFLATCPDAHVTGGADCGPVGSINDPGTLAACLACITAVKGDCIDRLQTPGVVDYPSECNTVIEEPEPGPGPGPTQVCPIDADANGFFTLTSALSDYRVRLPPTYDVDHPQPTRLVVGLHGCADTAANFATWAVVPYALRATQDYIGIAIGGRDGQCWNGEQDEPKILAAIAHVRSCFYVHQKKIVLAGYSSGGVLAYHLGFEDAATYAGILIENASLSAAAGGAGNVDAVLQAAAWRINVAHTARLDDQSFPLPGVQADRDKMLAAGIPLIYRELAGTHDGTSDDWSEFLLPAMADWTAP